MILRALLELATREGLVQDADYEPKPVHFLVRVGENDRITGFVSTLSFPTSEKATPRPKSFSVPRHSGRTSAATAEFLCDKAEYVFGFDPNGRRSSSDLAKRRGLFLRRLDACIEATNDPAVKALRKALEFHMGGEGPPLPKDVASNSLFAFIYEPDGDELMSNRPALRAYWRKVRTEPLLSQTGMSTCLVTGESCVATDKHPPIKRVPGANPSGAALVSFNTSVFESYGLDRNNNAPMSRAAAEAYTSALNRLLDPNYPNPRDGTPMGNRRVRLNDSTVAVFWSREQSDFVDLFTDVIEAKPEAVEALFRAPRTGRRPAIEDPQDFYALILSGAQGRILLRQWIETTVATAVRNIQRHFDDLEIVRPKGDQGPLPLRRLLRSTALLGKDENVMTDLAAQMFSAVIKGTRYPRLLLDTAIRRMRAEQSVTPERAALIKAYLLRVCRTHTRTDIPEVKMSIDEGSSSVAYRLGRLFAVLERVQQVAINPGATIRDRFFGAASANPVTVFPRLIRGAQAHLSKLSSAGFFQRLIGQILDGIPAERGFPAALSLEDQGLFALGYYHQRQAFFTRRTGAETSDLSAAEPTVTAK
jgi:CRISPR-associated protein Csd1